MRHPTAASVLFPTAMVLAALAGCAADSGNGSGATASTPGSSTGTETATAAATDLERAGSYAVIDGKKEPIPQIPMGDPATIARIIDEGKNRNRVMDHLTHLSIDIGPRLTGSSNLETANRWTRDQFEAWGLSIPAFGGVDGQASTDSSLRGLWQWGQIAVRFDRGPSTGKVLAIRNPESDTPEYRTVRDMEFTSLAWSPGTSGPVRGPVVKMPENEEQLSGMKDKVKDSWVLIKPTPGGRRGIISGAGARLSLYNDIRKKWKTGETAETAPAVDKDVTRYEGTLIGGQARDGMPFTLDVKLVDPTAVTGTISLGGFRTSQIEGGTFDAQTGELKFRTESQRGTREYALKIDGDTIKGQTELPDNGGTIAYSGKKVAIEEPKKGPTMEEKVLALEPAGWILPSSSDLVTTGGVPGWDKLDMSNPASDVIVTVRQSDYDCMNSRIADGTAVFAEFDLQHTFTNGPIPVYNTIAEITGTELPHEVVIVSGHLDTWNGPGSQGTTDNGTGSAVTLEAARILMAAKAKPKRTIRFILWTGEEQGLLGAVAYVKALKERGELDNVSAVFVDDGGTNYEGGLPCVESMEPYLAAATAPVNGHFYSETDKKFLDVNIHPGQVFTQVMGSDHNAFMREKIPGFFWDESGRAVYNYTHHTQHDKLDQAIPEYLRQSATCAAVTAYNLACAPEKLPRPTETEWPQGGRRRGGGGGVGGGGGQTQAPAGASESSTQRPADGAGASN